MAEARVIWRPQPKQRAFMERPEYEALYGGAAGGGKSDALLCEALRQVHIPHYRGLILRKTYPQLSELIDRSREIYRAQRAGGPEPGAVSRGVSPGEVRWHGARVAVSLGGEDLLRGHAVRERPDEIPGQAV